MTDYRKFPVSMSHPIYVGKKNYDVVQLTLRDPTYSTDTHRYFLSDDIVNGQKQKE